MNSTVLVGRLTKDPELKELESGKKVTNISIAVPRQYKSKDGEYETDFIDVELWEHVAEKTAEFCKKGDMIAIKGRTETSIYEKDDKKIKQMHIVGDKITFISSSKIKEQETEDNIEI